MKFPASLGPLYLELTSFHGNMFLPSSGSTKEGVLKLQTTKEEFTPFWFTLTSSNTLSAYRLNKFNRFECVCYWDVDDQTLIRSISDPPSLNDFVLRKKRDYDCYSEGYLFNDPDISFQISFSSTCCMAPRESCCILPDDSQTITLLAPDYASKCSWMETIQRRIVTLSDHSSTSPCTSPAPQSLAKSRTLPHNGSAGGFQRSATTESVLSQQGYINLPPVDSQQYEFLDLSPLQCQSSPPLIQLFWNISTTIQLTASPKYRLLGKTGIVYLS